MKNGNGAAIAAGAWSAPAVNFPKRNAKDAFEFSASLSPPDHPGTQLYLAGLIAAVAVAVVFFGGTETFSWAAAQILLLGMGVALVFELFRRPALPWRAWLIPAALLLWAAAQWHVPFEAVASLDHWATGEMFVRLLVYGSAFAAARRVARDERSAQRLILALMVLGVFEAAYGLAQYLTGWQKILWYERVYYRESATGTYVNHNHYAGFLEMVIPFAVARALSALPPRAGNHRAHAVTGKAALFLFLAAVLVLAVVFSQSRMGLIACVGSLAAMAAVLRLRGRNAAAPRGALRAGLILLLLSASAALMFWIGPEPVFTRFAQLPEQEEFSGGTHAGGRLAVWADTLRLLRERPLGVGLGAFEAAYTKVQTVDLNARLDYAHNDYLQVAAELGVPAALLFWAMIFALAARTLRACWIPADRARQAIALGATGALAALLLHSLTDFNLYIPANGLVFAVVLGLSSAKGQERTSTAAR